jgi:hypothetical protein
MFCLQTAYFIDDVKTNQESFSLSLCKRGIYNRGYSANILLLDDCFSNLIYYFKNLAYGFVEHHSNNDYSF